MDNAFVADASVGVAWAFPGQADERTHALAVEVLEGRPFTIPALWMAEVANSLLILQRRKKLDLRTRIQVSRDLVELGPTIDDEHPGIAFTRVSELAEKYDLSVYDATYLELALRWGLPLASRDGPLNKAAKKCGIETLL